MEAAGPVNSKTKPWIETLARFGYIAVGTVYILVGAIALRVVAGWGTQPEDTFSAMRVIGSGQLGRWAVLVVALGLTARALWRFLLAFGDPAQKHAGYLGVGRRVALVSGGIFAASLAFGIAKMLVGLPVPRSGEAAVRHWTGLLLSEPLGSWVLAAIGLITAGVSLRLIYSAVACKFDVGFKTSSMSEAERRGFVLLGCIGLISRAIITLLIGIFLVRTAWTYDPKDAEGLAGVLRTISAQKNGAWLLAGAGLGLICYGGFLALHARYRPVRETLDRIARANQPDDSVQARKSAIA